MKIQEAKQGDENGESFLLYKIVQNMTQILIST